MPEVDSVRPRNHLYALQSFPNRLLYAGHLPNGQQILVGPLPPDILILRFAPSGELVIVERQPLPELRNQDHFEQVIVDCFEALGAVSGTIRVYRFSSSDPGSLLGFIEESEDSNCYVQIEITDLRSEDLDEIEQREWLSSGLFILEWGDSYFVNADGRVICT